MGKVVSLRKLTAETIDARAEGQSIAFTNGCFDIIHAGHVRYLKRAKSMADILVVGMNSDRSIRAIKGPDRPIVPGRERAEVLASLDAVDYVVLFSEATPLKLIEAIRPDVLVKGADWAAHEIIGADVVKETGGRVARVRLVKGRSTTNIIKRILELHKK
jgi:D-beta-D-heptose 7-phosphate kinase/D-beta-D-heptose 1-phosphate adenosyltransferase